MISVRAFAKPSAWQCTIWAMALFVILGGYPRPSDAADLDWTIAPYLWAADVGLDIGVDSDPALGNNIPFNDLVDKLDSAFMGHLEVGINQYGAFFDAISLALTDNAVVPVGPGGPVLGDLLVATDVKLKLYELGGFYRFGGAVPGARAVDLIVGVRDVDLDQVIDIVLPGPGATPISRNLDVSETDIIVGARMVGRFNAKWGYKLRADYGNGGTEGTVNALATIGYTFGKTDLFSVDFGYRYMNVKLKGESDSTVYESDVTMSGPAIGFVFNF